MQEINFYQVDETIIKALAPLLIKVLEEKKRALIICKNQDQVKEIDDQLWSYGRNRFIPHAAEGDQQFDLSTQPIVIVSAEKNINKADYLVFLDEISTDFVKNFSRVFYFFEEHDLQEAKKIANKFKPSNSYKKVDGKWVKFSL